MADLDTILGEALVEDAEWAPELPATWSGPTVTMRVSARSPALRRRRLGGAILMSSAAAATIGLVWVADHGEDPPGEVEPADTGGWTPPGVEFPLEDLGVPDSDVWSTTVAGLARALGVEGHPPLVIATTLQYSGGATAELQRCLSERGSAGCAPEWVRDHFDIGVTSSVDNGVADYDLWTWANVPPDAAYVTYVDDPQVRWQRPVAGVAAFPNVDWFDSVAIAYTSNGTELARVDRAALDAADQRLEGPPPMADITRAQYQELTALTDTTLRDCLTDNGARLDANVAVLPAGVDDVEVWDQCVATVKQIVAERIDAMNVAFYDPITERPTVSNPAFQFDGPVATDEPS
jgi:hypothetical protein